MPVEMHYHLDNFLALDRVVTQETNEDEFDFATLVPGVKPLKNDRINIYQARERKAVSVRKAEASTNPAPDFAQLSFDQLRQIADSHFNHGINRKLQRKIRQGLLPIDDRLDLHGYRQQEATRVLADFIRQSLISGFKLVIVIHGKGNRSQEDAVLKPLIRHWLSEQHSVLAWCPAQPKHGGSGASYVYLRQGSISD